MPGEVIESVSGQSFEAVIEKNPLEPLGTDRTGFALVHSELWATPISGVAPRSTLGPPRDAARFHQAHLGDGELEGARILSTQWNCMRVYPDSGTGVFMMGNATSYDHDSIARALRNKMSTGGAQ